MQAFGEGKTEFFYDKNLHGNSIIFSNPMLMAKMIGYINDSPTHVHITRVTNE